MEKKSFIAAIFSYFVAILFSEMTSVVLRYSIILSDLHSD